MSNCPPEVFANVMGAPLCKICGKVWGVEDGCMCAEPALPIPPGPAPKAADDFAMIAQRMKEIAAAERSKPADASVSFRVADYLTDESRFWIPEERANMVIEFTGPSLMVPACLLWPEDGGE